MKIINLKDKKNSLIEIKKRIKIRSGILLEINQCAKIIYYINPISDPKKLSMYPIFSIDFTKYMIKKYIANELYNNIFRQTEQKAIKNETHEGRIYETVKIKDFNLIGLEDK